MKKKKKSSFKGKVVQNSHKQQSQGASYNHLRLPKGLAVFQPDINQKIRLDFLPYEVTSENHLDRDDEYGIAVPGELWYKKPYYKHRDIGANNESVVCPSTEKKKCPICEYRAKLMKEGANWDDETVRALRPSQRNLYAVVPRGNKKFEETVHLLDISQHCLQRQLNEEIEEDESYAIFPDTDEGLTLKIRFGEGKVGKTTFPEASRIDFMERDKPISDKLLDKVPHLDDILVIPSYKALEAMFFGGLDQEEAAGEDDEAAGEDDEAYEDEEEEVANALVEEDDDDEDIDEEDEEDDDEDIDDDEVEEDEDIDDSDDDDEEDDDEEADEEDEEVEEDEEPAPPPAPKRKAPKAKAKPAPKAPSKPASKSKGKAAKATAKGKCPHGHTFGVDCEEYDECDECEVWEECFDAKG
jgi:hypothetical protein